MASLSNLEKHALRRREESRRKQTEYARDHAIRKRNAREPTGRDVSAALLDLYVQANVFKRSTHAVVVERLVDRGFEREASANFVERLVERNLPMKI
jgi:hypothetical protein